MPSREDMNTRSAPYKRFYGIKRGRYSALMAKVWRGQKCYRCGVDATCADHIDEVATSVYNEDRDRYESSWGLWIHDESNLRPCCRKCNFATRSRVKRRSDFSEKLLAKNVDRDVQAARLQGLRAGGMRPPRIREVMGITYSKYYELKNRVLDAEGRSYATRRMEAMRPAIVWHEGVVDPHTKRDHNMRVADRIPFRLGVLARRSVCECCGTARATELDHIYPWTRAEQDRVSGLFVTDAGVVMDDESNLQCLCYDCHLNKTRLEKSLLFDLKCQRVHALRATGGGLAVICDLMGLSEPYVRRMWGTRLDSSGRSDKTNELLSFWGDISPVYPIEEFDPSVTDAELWEARSRPGQLIRAMRFEAYGRAIARMRSAGVTRLDVVGAILGLTVSQASNYSYGSLKHSVAYYVGEWERLHAHIPLPRL